MLLVLLLGNDFILLSRLEAKRKQQKYLKAEWNEFFSVSSALPLHLTRIIWNWIICINGFYCCEVYIRMNVQQKKNAMPPHANNMNRRPTNDNWLNIVQFRKSIHWYIVHKILSERIVHTLRAWHFPYVRIIMAHFYLSLLCMKHKSRIWVIRYVRPHLSFYFLGTIKKAHTHT